MSFSPYIPCFSVQTIIDGFFFHLLFKKKYDHTDYILKVNGFS